MFKKVVVYISVCIILIGASFLAGTLTTKHRLMEQHRLELDSARERAAVLTDMLKDIRTEVGEIGTSLDRQRTSVSELRALIAEVRTRYEKMEELLSCVGRDYSYTRNIDSNSDTTDEVQISD